MSKKIGIDLGTTYSCVSFLDDLNTVRIVDNSEGQQTTPSVVYLNPEEKDNAVVGSLARREGGMNPECLIERIKNYMGDPDYVLDVGGVSYSPAAISSLILQKLIKDTENALGDEEIEGAVITCPAYFGEAARNATRLAGEHVKLKNGKNLTVFSILDEPVAAAVAYGHSLGDNDMDKNILIYDLGGGTFDCTVMQISLHGDDKRMKVVTTGGNHQLGGKDWDAKLTDIIREKFCRKNGFDEEEMKNDAESIIWFSENSEQAKIVLTAKETTKLVVSYGGKKEKIEVSRAEFEEATKELLDETIQLVDDMLAKKGLDMKTDIDEIILVGGSTFMPQVQHRLEQDYGKPLRQYEPNKAVAMGAAIMANGYSVKTEMVTDDNGELQEKKTVSFGLTDGSGDAVGQPVIEATVTKSYGVRLYSNGQEVVYNIIKKDTRKPAIGSTEGCDVLRGNIRFGDPRAQFSEIPLLVLENDSFEDAVGREECQDIYEEEPLKFDDVVPGSHRAQLVMEVTMDGILKLKITDVDTNKTYEVLPRRKSDETNEIGFDAIDGFQLS